MSEPHPPEWTASALGLVGVALTAFLGWLGVRTTARAPKSDPQAALNEGWDDLLKRMRSELIAASRERNHLNQVLEEERRAWRVEREAWRVEREAFLGEIRQLQAVAEGFERLLKRHGFELPERKSLADPVQLVDVTLRQASVDDAG